jgi:hypothetical protein
VVHGSYVSYNLSRFNAIKHQVTEAGPAGRSAMSSPGLGIWSVAVGAVRVAPGLAILSAPMIARLIHRMASPDSEIAPKPGREPSHGEPAAVPAQVG